jgi:hypothetical protein
MTIIVFCSRAEVSIGQSSQKRAATAVEPSVSGEFEEAVQATSVTSVIIGDGPVIGTHSGAFHCDEALACAMLKLLPEFKTMRA